MNKQIQMSTTTTVLARQLKAGLKMADREGRVLAVISRVMVCSDGSIRVHHQHGESRMTGSIPVRVIQ